MIYHSKLTLAILKLPISRKRKMELIVITSAGVLPEGVGPPALTDIDAEMIRRFDSILQGEGIPDTVALRAYNNRKEREEELKRLNESKA